MDAIDRFNTTAESAREILLPKDLFGADNDVPTPRFRRGGKAKQDSEGFWYIEWPTPATKPKRTMGNNFFVPFPFAPVAAKKAAEIERMAPEFARIAKLQAWKLTAPANDEDLLPMPTRNKGAHPDMQPFLGALRWWRQMMSPPAEMGAMPMAANDNEFIPAVMDRNPAPMEGDDWLALWSDTDQEFVPVEVKTPVWVGQRRVVAGQPVQRLARAGGLWFSTVDNANAVDKRVERDTAKGTTKPTYRITLGSIYAYQRGLKKVFITQDNARNRDDEKVEFVRNVKRGAEAVAWRLRPVGSEEPLEFRYVKETNPYRKIQKPINWSDFAHIRGGVPLAEARLDCGLPSAEKLPLGLPCASRDISASFLSLTVTPDKAAPNNVDGADGHAKRVQSDLGYAALDRMGDADSYRGFRVQFETESQLLDLATTAGPMSDLAPLAGSNDAGTCKRHLKTAVASLQAYLQKIAA